MNECSYHFIPHSFDCELGLNPQKVWNGTTIIQIKGRTIIEMTNALISIPEISTGQFEHRNPLLQKFCQRIFFLIFDCVFEGVPPGCFFSHNSFLIVHPSHCMERSFINIPLNALPPLLYLRRKKYRKFELHSLNIKNF